MSGCKVADGVGNMLVNLWGFCPFLASVFSYAFTLFSGSYSLWVFQQVTGVGINTEWGLLMASISEDTGEETPLQVYHLDHFFYWVMVFTMSWRSLTIPFGNLITGATKWSCNLHRHSGALSGSCCPGGSSCEVILFTLVNKSFGLKLHAMLRDIILSFFQIFYRNYSRS